MNFGSLAFGVKTIVQLQKANLDYCDRKRGRGHKDGPGALGRESELLRSPGCTIGRC